MSRCKYLKRELSLYSLVQPIAWPERGVSCIRFVFRNISQVLVKTLHGDRNNIGLGSNYTQSIIFYMIAMERPLIVQYTVFLCLNAKNRRICLINARWNVHSYLLKQFSPCPCFVLAWQSQFKGFHGIFHRKHLALRFLDTNWTKEFGPG